MSDNTHDRTTTSATKAATDQAVSVVSDARDRGERTPFQSAHGSEGRLLLRFSVPLAFGFVVNAVYSWTDMYFVSRLGESAIAALGFSEQINFVLFTVGSGFCIGTGIVIARRIGEGRREDAMVIATQAMSFMALFSTIVSACLLLVLPSILPALRLTHDVARLTEDYMLVLLIGFPANLVMFLSNCTIRSTGNTVFPMAVVIVSAICNACLDPLLMFGVAGIPAMGIRGAGLATAIAQWCGAAISLHALYTGRLNLHLRRPSLRLDWSTIRTIFAVGIPSSLQSLAVSTSRLAMISMANNFGVAAAAAYTVGLKVDILVFMPIFASGVAIETLVSQSLGAKRFERVRLFRLAAIRQMSVFVCAVGVVVYLFAEVIARIFTNDRDVIEASEAYMHFAVFGYFFFVIGQTGTRSLSGAGHTVRSMLIVVAVLFGVMVPLAWLLSTFTPLQERGVYLSIAASYAVYAAVATYAIRGDSWMKKAI